ncbi:hypothetical protein BAL199_12001 [alpha proteobacterium BAL199]|jgi:hypothetical protein|nr:hypothetical protein BAL199_12001 [alpha proteobacterium BAL199]
MIDDSNEPAGISVLAPDEPILRPLWHYWSERRRSRQCPARADIDPVDIPQLLPHIGLIDVEVDGPRFKYRLIGTRMNEIFGQNFSGSYLDESKNGQYAIFLHNLYAEAAGERRGLFSETVFGYRDSRHLTVHRLILPLAENDESPVTMLLFANTFRLREPGDPEVPDIDGAMPYLADDIVDIRPVAHHPL